MYCAVTVETCIQLLGGTAELSIFQTGVEGNIDFTRRSITPSTKEKSERGQYAQRSPLLS